MIQLTLPQVAGDKTYGLGIVTVGERDTGVAGCTTGGGDSRHNLERDVFLASSSISSPPRPK